METKQAITREEAKAAGLKRYFTGEPCGKGHVADRSVSNRSCLECCRERMAAEYVKSPEKANARSKKWRESNLEYARDASRARHRARRANDPEKVRENQRNYYAKNAEKITAQERLRRREDSIHAFNKRSSALIRKAITRSGFKKNSRAEEVLGCTFDEFRSQIERQFLPGMGWHNMRLWEIDHIVPASSAKTQKEAEALNRAGNLRPLWRKENRSKHAKSLFLV